MIFSYSRLRNIALAALLTWLLLLLISHRDRPDPAYFGSRTRKHKPNTSNKPTTARPSHSNLHYLVPASESNLHLCINLASSILNRYPSPVLLGLNTSNPDFDLVKSHSTKLDTIKRYLDALPSAEDDDLVLIVDGYDITLQLPAEILIQRYFTLAAEADARLAKEFSLTVEQAHSQGLRNTIFWGPDKACFPGDDKAARCWAVPPSTLQPKAFGPKSNNGEIYYQDPKWLNSGTVIGPAADLRRYIDATLRERNETYDPDYQFNYSDQLYFANVWARQEYFRAKESGKPPSGPVTRKIPQRKSDEATEYHIAIDYESALFQTKAGYEPFFGRQQFSGPGFTSLMDVDMFEKGADFVPFPIDMPANVYSALMRLYRSIPHLHRGVKPGDWIRTLNLGVNYVTKQIFVIWNCTAHMGPVHEEYPEWWFYPYAKSLQKAAVKAARAHEPIAPSKVDGRIWSAKTIYPDRKSELGGAWSDEGQFYEWQQLCKDHEDMLFRGETG